MKKKSKKEITKILLAQIESERLKFVKEMENPTETEKKDNTTMMWAEKALIRLRALEFIEDRLSIYFQNVERYGIIHFGSPLPACFRLESNLVEYLKKNKDKYKVIENIISTYFVVTSQYQDHYKNEIYLFVEFDIAHYRKNIIDDVE